MGSDPIILMHDVSKQYGGLRPLRVRRLDVEAHTSTMLLGFDPPTAETFINLMTGASLPESGNVTTFGRDTRDIADSAEWLTFVERFGIVSDRVVLLESMTVAQNLAISFDLELDPVPSEVMARVLPLADEVGIEPAVLTTRVGDGNARLQAGVRLARALALDPELLVLEHPTATLAQEDVTTYAGIIRNIAARRRLTVLGLTADEKFAKQINGRLLVWQPATGELHEESRRKFWPFR